MQPTTKWMKVFPFDVLSIILKRTVPRRVPKLKVLHLFKYRRCCWFDVGQKCWAVSRMSWRPSLLLPPLICMLWHYWTASFRQHQRVKRSEISSCCGLLSQAGVLLMLQENDVFHVSCGIDHHDEIKWCSICLGRLFSRPHDHSCIPHVRHPSVLIAKKTAVTIGQYVSVINIMFVRCIFSADTKL